MNQYKDINFHGFCVVVDMFQNGCFFQLDRVVLLQQVSTLWRTASMRA